MHNILECKHKKYQKTGCTRMHIGYKTLHKTIPLIQLPCEDQHIHKPIQNQIGVITRKKAENISS